MPESWPGTTGSCARRTRRRALFATFGFFVTLVAMLGVLIAKIIRRDVPWKLVASFGGIACVLAFLSRLNDIPLTLFDYDTASPLSSYLTKQLVSGSWARSPRAPGSPWSWRRRSRSTASVSRSSSRFRDVFAPRASARSGSSSGVLLGYALTAFFFAYQAVFYVVAAKLGAWAPADIPYSDMLNTAFPWATVLLIGFLPAVSEEGIEPDVLDLVSRQARRGPVRGGRRAGRSSGDSATSRIPNQPFYIRGVEVGVAGIVMGVLHAAVRRAGRCSSGTSRWTRVHGAPAAALRRTLTTCSPERSPRDPARCRCPPRSSSTSGMADLLPEPD